MRLTLISLIALGALPGLGQSFNIDLDIMGGPPEIGNGAPSDAFGAAANQPGRWNRVPGLAVGPAPLVDIHGTATTVSYSVNNYGGGNDVGGFFFEGNTGDYALLLNDARQIGPVVQGGRNTFKFSGIAPGTFDIYTYAAHIAGIVIDVPVTVWEATQNQTQVVSGPMPGNAFEYLVTHSIHRVSVLGGGDVHVDIIQPPGQHEGFYVNGFQIVAVPEPATWLAMITLSAAILRRRIKQNKNH